MTQGYIIFDCPKNENGQTVPGAYEQVFVDMHRDLKIVDVQIDKPLPDDLFTMEFKEGVQVFDRSHDPPLIYKYKKDMPADEWAKIVADAEKQKAQDDAVKKLQAALAGKPAPEFPPTTWINSPPLAWNDLKGKIVILDFFAEWCGPCRNDLPAAAQIHARREQDGIVILGIHTPGTSRDKIDKLLADFHLEYPVCIDVPSDNHASWGRLFDAYHVNSIPFSVLVDQDGNVAGSGNLGEMCSKAFSLKKTATGQ
jgi:thiol-disulfide isomerase/thioredoxin